MYLPSRASILKSNIDKVHHIVDLCIQVIPTHDVKFGTRKFFMCAEHRISIKNLIGLQTNLVLNILNVVLTVYFP
jgi:hypothetical protein